MDKTGGFPCSYNKQQTTTKGKTWSRGTNSRFLLAVDKTINLPNLASTYSRRKN